VLLACVAGALRSYLVAYGDVVDGAELRAMVPVNLRPPGAAASLGNKFAWCRCCCRSASTIRSRVCSKCAGA